jgi:hypothetical protein
MQQSGVPEPIGIPKDPYKPEGADVTQIVKINSGLIK